MPVANWTTLINNIRAGVCVPFLGAGAAHGVLPTGGQLARALLDAADPPLSPFPFPDAQSNLAKVAQVAAAVAGDAVELKRRVCGEISAHLKSPDGTAVESPALHLALARLRLPLYVTTNYDMLLEQALAAVGVPHHSEICRWNGTLLEEEASVFDEDRTDDPVGERSLVFHLHGRVDKPESIVVTEDDYLDFLLNVTRDVGGKVETRNSKALLPPRVRKYLKNRPLVFVGYSLTDVNFLVILRGLLRTVEPSNRVQRVAVYLDPADLPAGSDLKAAKDHIEKYFHWTLSLEVFWGTAATFTSQLLKSLTATGTTPVA